MVSLVPSASWLLTELVLCGTRYAFPELCLGLPCARALWLTFQKHTSSHLPKVGRGGVLLGLCRRGRGNLASTCLSRLQPSLLSYFEKHLAPSLLVFWCTVRLFLISTCCWLRFQLPKICQVSGHSSICFATCKISFLWSPLCRRGFMLFFFLNPLHSY